MQKKELKKIALVTILAAEKEQGAVASVRRWRMRRRGNTPFSSTPSPKADNRSGH